MEGATDKMLIRKITSNGNSWVINLPRVFLRPLGFKPGQYIQITVLPDNTLHLRPVLEEIYDIRRV